jgi:hypothetical protein
MHLLSLIPLIRLFTQATRRTSTMIHRKTKSELLIKIKLKRLLNSLKKEIINMEIDFKGKIMLILNANIEFLKDVQEVRAIQFRESEETIFREKF